MALPVATKISAHVTSALLAGAYATAFRRHYVAWEGDLSGISADALILAVVLPAIIFAVLFGIGHNFLRRLTLNARYTYSLMGAASLCIATAVILPAHIYEAASRDGVVSVFIALTAAAGSLIGFLHVRSAGREISDDEIAEVESATYPDPAAPDIPAVRDGELPGVVSTPSAEFYSGPVQVVSSWSATFTAALVGGLAHTFYTGFVMLAFSDGFSGQNDGFVEQFVSGEIFTSIVFSLLFSILLCLFFLPPAIYCLHKLLNARGRMDMSAYVIVGGLAPLAVGLAMFVIGIMFTHWFAVPLAVAMGVYHHLAGLEPAKLPDDIEVTDKRTLVSEDHVRRRLRRIAG